MTSVWTRRPLQVGGPPFTWQPAWEPRAWPGLFWLQEQTPGRRAAGLGAEGVARALLAAGAEASLGEGCKVNGREVEDLSYLFFM
jgi:hypothetical protein